MGLFSVYPIHVSEAAMCTGEQGSRPELTLATCLQLNWFSSSQNLQLQIHPDFTKSFWRLHSSSFKCVPLFLRRQFSVKPKICSLDSVALPADLWSRLYSSCYILYLVGDILGQNKAAFFFWPICCDFIEMLRVLALTHVHTHWSQYMLIFRGDSLPGSFTLM